MASRFLTLIQRPRAPSDPTALNFHIHLKLRRLMLSSPRPCPCRDPGWAAQARAWKARETPTTTTLWLGAQKWIKIRAGPVSEPKPQPTRA